MRAMSGHEDWAPDRGPSTRGQTAGKKSYDLNLFSLRLMDGALLVPRLE